MIVGEGFGFLSEGKSILSCDACLTFFFGLSAMLIGLSFLFFKNG